MGEKRFFIAFFALATSCARPAIGPFYLRNGRHLREAFLRSFLRLGDVFRRKRNSKALGQLGCPFSFRVTGSDQSEEQSLHERVVVVLELRPGTYRFYLVDTVNLCPNVSSTGKNVHSGPLLWLPRPPILRVESKARQGLGPLLLRDLLLGRLLRSHRRT